MERTSPNYNDPQFKNPDNDNWDKYDKGIDKALNTINTVHSAGRRIGYILGGLFFFTVGTALLIWAVFNIKGKIDSINSFEKTMGTVVRMREVPETEDAGVTYAPVISYTDKQGNKYEYESNISSDPPAYKMGEKVELIYDPKNPDDALINTFWGRWSGTIILVTAPLLLIPLGVYMLFRGFRRNKYSSFSQNNSNSNSSSGQDSTYVSIG